MPFKIDAGGCTFLPLCTSCGWRGLPMPDRSSALRSARHHEMRAHPGELHAAKMLDNQTRRHR